MHVRPTLTKLLAYVRKHRMAITVTIVILCYEISRMIHAEMMGREFLVGPIVEVMLSRLLGGGEE